MLRPLNTVPHVVVTPNHTNENCFRYCVIIYYIFATVMNHVNTCFLMVLDDPQEEVMTPRLRTI